MMGELVGKKAPRSGLVQRLFYAANEIKSHHIGAKKFIFLIIQQFTDNTVNFKRNYVSLDSYNLQTR